MPIMGGFEACSLIKNLIKQQKYKNAAVIGYTGLLTDAEKK